VTWPWFLDRLTGLSDGSRTRVAFAAQLRRAAEEKRVEGASWEELQAMAATEVGGYMDAWAGD
jgi:hypothetical protein